MLMDRRVENDDTTFGFEWATVEGEYYLRNDDGEFKRVTRPLVEFLKSGARRDSEYDLRSLEADLARKKEAAAETFRELKRENYVREDQPVVRLVSPDDITLWPRSLAVLVMGLAVLAAAVAEFSSLSVESVLGSATALELGATVALIVASAAIHEYGHYRVSSRYFSPSVEFGVINAVVPVVKTDTNGAWLLPRNIRRWINLAGAFFQLGFLIGAIALHYLVFPDSIALSLLIVSSTVHLFFSLNPLYHGDGYWLLVDTFDLVNLNQRGRRDLRALTVSWPAVYSFVSYGFAIVMMVTSLYVAYDQFGPVAVAPIVGFVGFAYLLK